MAKLTLADPLDCIQMRRRWLKTARDWLPDEYIQKWGLESETNGAHEEDSSRKQSDEPDEDIRSTIHDEMMDWLAQLWLASPERGSEVDRTVECLKLCWDTIPLFEFGVGRGEDVVLRDSSGTKLCASYDYWPLICLILQEVLINAWTMGNDNTERRVKEVLRDRDWCRFDDDDYFVIWLEEDAKGQKLPEIRREAIKNILLCLDEIETGSTESTQEENQQIPTSRAASEDTSKEKNVSLSEGISSSPAEGLPLPPRSSAKKASYKDKLLSRFASKLDKSLCDRFLSEFPDAQEDALQTARAKFFADKPPSSTCWSDAFYILSKSDKIEDIDRLLRVMPSFVDKPDSEESRIRAVQFLLQKPSHRETAVSSLMDGLRATSKAFLDDLHSCFPNIDDACGALILEFSRGDLLRYCSGTAQALTTRNQELDRFVNTALGGPRYVPMVPSSHGLSIAERLRGWMGVLNELPRWMPRKRMLAIREEVMGEIGNHRLFKDAGDFAEILMLRCHGRRKETEEALREAYNLFAPAKPVIAKTPMLRGVKRDRPQSGLSNKKAKYG